MFEKSKVGYEVAKVRHNAVFYKLFVTLLSINSSTAL